ncbi:MAG TPA: hypothetical protein VK892_22735 [Pyrinomonadaceae bacterium]|nr:hypothetical protein [Pyrinomonadaceae bacterium]
MGDYLSELAKKNLGTANVIQPRRASRFEQVQTQGAHDSQTEPLSLQAESFDIVQAVNEEHGGAINPDVRQRRPMRLSRKDELISSEDDADERTPLFSPPKGDPPVTKQTAENASLSSNIIEEVRETANEILSQPRPPSPAVVKPKESLLISGEAEEKTNITLKQASIKPHFPQSKEVELKIPETKNSAPQVISKQSPETPSQVIVKPRFSKSEERFGEFENNQNKILPAREKMPKQISESAKTADVPVINVTIGRIEIRAVNSSAPVKQARTKPATLSLEEYLRKRSNGGGR